MTLVEQKIYLDGYIDVPTERWQNIMHALPKHIELTLDEPGCLKFDVKPCDQVEHRLLVSEIFENKAAFDHHNLRMKSSDWYKVTEGVSRHYEISNSPPDR